MLVLVRSFSYTPDVSVNEFLLQFHASFNEEFLLHSPDWS